MAATRKIKAQAMAAASSLLGLAPAAARAAESPRWDVNGSLLNYSERGRIGVLEPTVAVREFFSDKRELNLLVTVDTISGSTPIGTLPSSGAVTLTTPSGRSSSVASGQTPMGRYHDTRYGFDAAWKQPIGSRLLATLGGAFSMQSDYLTYGENFSLAADFNQKNTTVVLGLSPETDVIHPHGGIPGAFASTLKPVGTEATKHILSFLAGVTQIVDARTLMQFNYSRTAETGYITDPYKQLSLVDAVTGNPVSSVYEKRPGTRNGNSLYWLTRYNLLPDHVVSGSYRYYWDDWGVRAHTVDATERWQFTERAYVEPHLRFYHQNHANFFNVGLVNGAPLPGLASSDYRLAAFSAYTIGLRGGWTLDNGSIFALRLEYYTQLGDAHPAGAVGVQRNYDLFPTLHATIFQIQYGFDPAALRGKTSFRS